MAPVHTAGLLLWRRTDDRPEVLIAHMGGPFWSKKDEGAWSIPKGECEDGEEFLDTAYREFAEEMGGPAPDAEPVALGEAKQRNGKIAVIWAIEGDFDAESMVSNLFEMEWPPKSGRMQQFPEMDRAAWFDLDTARAKLLPAQELYLDRLVEALEL